MQSIRPDNGGRLGSGFLIHKGRRMRKGVVGMVEIWSMGSHIPDMFSEVVGLYFLWTATRGILNFHFSIPLVISSVLGTWKKLWKISLPGSGFWIGETNECVWTPHPLVIGRTVGSKEKSTEDGRL